MKIGKIPNEEEQDYLLFQVETHLNVKTNLPADATTQSNIEE